MNWCFSTLGCPELSLQEVCALAADFEIPRLEIRALCGRMDLPRLAGELNLTPESARAILEKYDCNLHVAGSSFKLIGSNAASRAEFIEFCHWANAWGFPFIRVFGGETWGQSLNDSHFDEAAATVVWWRNERKNRGWRSDILLETHDAFSASAPCCNLMARVEQPIGIIWDSHHTWRLGQESPAESWSQLSAWIRHVHIKDSIDKPSARHPYSYVLPGDGQAPLTEIIALLRNHQFPHAISFEWEKQWHPYLPPLRTALERLRSLPWFSGAPGKDSLPNIPNFSLHTEH